MGVAVFEDEIEEIVIFRWNRRYPSDLQLDFNPIEHKKNKWVFVQRLIQSNDNL